MEEIILVLLVLYVSSISMLDQSSAINFDYTNLNEDVYKQQVNLMTPKKTPHEKSSSRNKEVTSEPHMATWPPHDLSKFEDYKESYNSDESGEHSRVKRRAKNTRRVNTKIRDKANHYKYPDRVKERIPETTTTTKRPGILPEHMNPGVIFRVRMSDAILRIKQRMYEDPERHIESDIIYTNLIKKVVMDEITKFHNLLLMYKTDKSIKEHLGECGGRIYKFISYMTIKVHIYCLFDALWIDGNPYVIGDEYTVTPVEVPPLLQCDAAECNSIVFVDSIAENTSVEE